MRILIGIGIGVFGVLAYQDPAIVDPAMQYAKEIINQIASFLVDKTQ